MKSKNTYKWVAMVALNSPKSLESEIGDQIGLEPSAREVRVIRENNVDPDPEKASYHVYTTQTVENPLVDHRLFKLVDTCSKDWLEDKLYGLFRESEKAVQDIRIIRLNPIEDFWTIYSNDHQEIKLSFE